MKISNLHELLKKHFPEADIPNPERELTVGSFPEWDSLGHFNFLLFIEESYGIRFSVEEMSEMKSLKDISDVLALNGVNE